MKKITILGAGKIGILVALLLKLSGKYQVQIVDRVFSKSFLKLQEKHPEIEIFQIDINAFDDLISQLKTLKPAAIVSCLPYFLNKNVAEIAKEVQCAYFDLTEDVATTQYIKDLAKGATNVFVPQCGLAPGMIGTIAYHYFSQFTEVETVEMRVGALPQFSNNGLKYALNWSTDGLINEYDNPCEIIKNGRVQTMPSLESREVIALNGAEYEAFSTSGGLGSLVELLDGKVKHLNYKTIRYPGHCEKIRFLLRDLNLQNDRDLLKEVLENALPRTDEDSVIMLINVVGQRDGNTVSKQFIKTIFPKVIAGKTWAAIQVTTASGLCTVLDTVMDDIDNYSGFIYQEQLPFEAISQSTFSRCYFQ